MLRDIEGLVDVLGKSRLSTGCSSFDSLSVIPTVSSSLPTPDHRQMAPAMEIASSTPAWAPVSTEAARAGVALLRMAQIRLRASIPVQILLMTIKITPFPK
jgi:hypothetical protein